MSSTSFLARHEFLLRRLHSLTGLIPIGLYLIVHLLVNASVMIGPTVFQKNVYQIHSLESVLWVVEWLFIFLPLLFHGILGVVITYGGLPNQGAYPYEANIRYTLQRATGLIALAFILWHVFHMHGWFHNSWWVENVAEPFNGHQFRPYNASSTLGAAMTGLLVQVLYAVGMLAAVFHLANGLWTMGITWGAWTSPAGQRRALGVCGVFGVLLAGVGMAALVGAANVDVEAAREAEQRMYEARLESGDVLPNPAKRSSDGHAAGGHAGGPTAQLDPAGLP